MLWTGTAPGSAAPEEVHVKRREFLRYAGVMAGAVVAGSGLFDEALADTFAQTAPGPYGPLLPPDANGFMLPAGFQVREIARAGQLVSGTTFAWHVFPDGGATFPVPGGWVYVSNCEFITGEGVGAIRFDPAGQIVDAYRICSGTVLNCAGGATAWNTWLTCEEAGSGLVHECDPLGIAAQRELPGMGRFAHEAAACDPWDRRFYLTEDKSDGCFYRFTPDVWGDLTQGLLEVAEVDAQGFVQWHEVPEPDPPTGSVFAEPDSPTRYQVAAATPFNGGEGIVYGRGHLYFTTKGDNRVWDYAVDTQEICVLYDRALDAGQTLSGVDNITRSRSRDLIVAEDHGGGEQELVVITPAGTVSPLLRMIGQTSSEIAGPAFDPGERRLYFSSQRGAQYGITYELSGPFRQRLGC
jgi:secreted PhoX family phosphatase